MVVSYNTKITPDPIAFETMAARQDKWSVSQQHNNTEATDLHR